MGSREREPDPNAQAAPAVDARAAAPVIAPAPVAAPAVAAPASVANVLALQRAGGNAAVAQLLARDPDPKLEGNPADRGRDDRFGGTEHREPTIADAANKDGPAPAAQDGAETMTIRLVATPEAPVIGETVAEEQLFERLPASGPVAAAPPGFQDVQAQHGTAAAPVVDEVADNSLFIDDGPKADDLQQGGLGDCWDIATFIAIVNRDPGKIRSMMVPDAGAGATVTFYRMVKADPGALDRLARLLGRRLRDEYVEQPVKASSELAVERSRGTGEPIPRVLLPDGRFYGNRLAHAQLRAAPRPKERKWWVTLNGGTLEVHRLDVFQMARWGPLMEKAAARFSERWGQYGHSGRDDAPGTDYERRSPLGYENLQGGKVAHTHAMFYGAPGDDFDAANPTYDANQTGTNAVLAINQASFDILLTLAGRGDRKHPEDASAPVVTVGTDGEAGYLSRLGDALAEAPNDPEWASLPAPEQQRVTAVGAALQAYNAATPAAAGTYAALHAAVDAAVAPATNPTFVAARSPKITALRDLLLVIHNAGRDTGGDGQRSVYANHAYAVIAMSIANTPDAPHGFAIQSLPPDQRPASYRFVDVNLSTVTLRNPHHANAPNADRTPEARGQSGVFDVSLSRFFTLFQYIHGNEYKATP